MGKGGAAGKSYRPWPTGRFHDPIAILDGSQNTPKRAIKTD
jgi:hypothetical protein